MANLTVFSVRALTFNDYKIFTGLYNDFKNRAISDYKFDLEPLDYDDFINAIDNKLLKCLVLYENSIPTGFLIYTTLISYSVELNIIHLISDENYETKVRYLVNDFIKREADILTKKIITYPLLGDQQKFKTVLIEFGFKFVTQSILKFDFTNPSCITKISEVGNMLIPYDYIIQSWKKEFFGDAVKLIHNNFKNANDALFDPRFCSIEGTKDIVSKIVNSGYGEFLSQNTKVIFKYGKMVGICFVNVTGNGLVNIPLVAIDGPFRHQKLGQKLISLAVKEVLESTLNGIEAYKEVNVTTDLSNISAVKMYKNCGFFEDYEYLQSYRN